MPFCTNCGTRVEAESHFCEGCGKALGNGKQAAPPPPPEPLDYTIQGETMQVVRIRLKPGQDVFAEAGKMVYKLPETEWESRLAGEALVLTNFSATAPSEVGFAGACPGRIQAIDLKEGQSLLVLRDGFLCAQSTVRLEVVQIKKPDGGSFGGDGLLLERLTGPGTVFIHAGGESVEFGLDPGQVIQVNAGSLVAFDESIGYDMQLADGIKPAMLGAEGLLLATLTGPGRVMVQSLTLEKTRRELSLSPGAGENGAVPVLNGALVG
jgi:uncharacterized protein (AIM24 family)